MYAVIKTGGKQYKVSHGHVLRVEKLDAEVGTQIDFSEVLLVSDGSEISVGAPYVDNSKVSTTVQAQGRGKKIKIIKMRRRKHYRKQMGHRQAYTELKVTGIVALGKELLAPVSEATPEPTTSA
jgi:large subunit ribosomal protein L21